MKMRSRTLTVGLFLAIIGIACVALFAGKAHAEDNEWSWGDPYPPISGNGWGISKEGTLTVVTNAGWRDFLANGPGEWIWEYDEYMRNERVKKLVIGKNVTSLSIYDPTHWNDDSMQEGDYQLSYNAGIYTPYISVYMQDPKCMPPEIEVEEGNGVFSVENGLLINNVKKSVVLSEFEVSDVIIPEGIREIEAWAFYYRNITSVEFPESLEAIGAAAFSNCNYLTEVRLPNTLTRMDTGVFTWCSSLEKVTISSGLETIEGLAFKGCPLENVTIPEGVQTIGFMAFSDCDDLKQVSLPESLETIDNYAFADCKNLKDIPLPPKLSYIGYRAFEFCESLQVILMPNSLTTIGEEAFLGCESTLVQLPEKFTVRAVPPEERGWSANLEEEEESTRLLGIDYVETLIVSGTDYSMGRYAVKQAKEVVFLQKPPADWQKITTIIFSQNVYYLDQYVSDWVAPDKTVWGGLTLNQLTHEQLNQIIESCKKLAEGGYTPEAPELPAVEEPLQVFEHEGWSMSNDGVLTLRSNEGWLDFLRQDVFEHPGIIIIGKDVTDITLYDMSETVPVKDFYRAKDIIGYEEDGSAIYSYAESSYINPMRIYLEPGNKTFIYGDGMLVNIRKMEIVLSDGAVPDHLVIPEGIRSIGNGALAFTNMRSIQLPSSLETIGSEAFESCQLLRIEMPNTVTSIGKFAFRDCKNLRSIKLSEGLTRIEEGTFWESGLDEVVLPDGIREVGMDAFFRCSNLKHVQLSSKLKFIRPSAFEDCERLKYVWFSNKIEEIGPRAFFWCRELEVVILPDSLRKIGTDVFSQCELLLLRVPPKLQMYIYDWQNQKFLADVPDRDQLTFGLNSVDAVVFSGSEYDLGEPALENAKNVYFQALPPANVAEMLDLETTEQIYCSDEFEFEWTRSTIASGVRQKLQSMPADEMNRWVEKEINATPVPATEFKTMTLVNTPKPTATPQPSASPASTNEPEKKAGDPIIILLIVFIVLVILAVVLLILKPWAKNKRHRKKRRIAPQLPEGTPTPNEMPETRSTDKLE